MTSGGATLQPTDNALAFLQGGEERRDWLACEHDFPRFAVKVSTLFLKALGEHIYPMAQFHWDLVEDARQYNRLVVLVSRDHLKSTIFSQLHPLWEAAFQPGGVVQRQALISDTKEQAKLNLEYIKMMIDAVPWLQQLKPENPEIWTKTRVKLLNGSDISVSGFGSPIRGAHKHRIVLDDILGDTQRFTFEFMDKFIKRAITPMVLPGGAIVVVGTPQHHLDPVMKLLDNPAYESRIYPAVLDWDAKEVLWPDRWGWDALMALRKEIGAAAFDQEYQCKPVDDSSSLFPWKLISDAFCPQLRCVKAAGGTFPVFVGVDIAKSGRVGADWWVAVIIEVDDAGNRTILDIERAKGLTLPQQLEKLQSIGTRFNPEVICIEANALQSFVTDEAVRQTDLPIRPHTTGKEKAKVTEGVPSLVVHFENGKYRLPRGDEASCTKTDILAHELNHFGWEGATVKGKGAHDDTVMALWLADLAIRGKRRRLRRFILR